MVYLLQWQAGVSENELRPARNITDLGAATMAAFQWPATWRFPFYTSSISSLVTEAGLNVQAKDEPETFAVSSLGSTACGWSKSL